MSDLRVLLNDSLPTAAQLESVFRYSHGFAFVFLDDAGARHTIDFWSKGSEQRAFRTGRYLAFAYRPSQLAGNDYALEQQTIVTLLAAEEKIFAAMQSFLDPPEVRPVPSRPIFLRESNLVMHLLRALPRSNSLVDAVHAALKNATASDEPASEVHLYFETACAQACEFCEEPVKRARVYRRAMNRLLILQHDFALDLVSSGALRALLDIWAEQELPVTITGHDWTRHPHRDELLRILEANKRLKLRLQGPSLAFDSKSLARRIAALPNLQWIATTMQSADAAEHDGMVGARGAFSRLIPALENLHELGVRVNLTLVLTRRALRTLPLTLEFLHQRNWFVELAAFVPDKALGNVRDTLAPLDELKAALERALPAAREVVRSLVGTPPCAIPEVLRSKVAPVLRTSEREAMQWARDCRSCGAFSTCSGVPAGYMPALGTRGITPI